MTNNMLTKSLRLDELRLPADPVLMNGRLREVLNQAFGETLSTHPEMGVSIARSADQLTQSLQKALAASQNLSLQGSGFQSQALHWNTSSINGGPSR